MREQDVIDMRQNAMAILQAFIDDDTFGEITNESSIVERERAATVHARMTSIASLGTTMIFGCLAEIVMIRQAMVKQADAMTQLAGVSQELLIHLQAK